MDRRELLFLLCLLGLCAAQDGSTCEQSSADFCVRTCCPEGQNVITQACTDSSLGWEPSFLNESVRAHLEVVGGFIPPCPSGKEERLFGAHSDPSTRYVLHPSGELDVNTSEAVHNLGHDYCFYNVEHAGLLFETVRSCVPTEVPQVPGLVSIDNVTEVSFQKCCPEDQVLGVKDQDFACVSKSTNWLPRVIHGDPTELIELPPQKANITALGQFKCPKDTVSQYLTSSSNPEHAFFLEADSRLFLAGYNLSIQPGHFCLDSLKSSSSTPQSISQTCYDKTEEHTKEEFENLCPEGVCVRKCCAPQFHLYNTTCIPTQQEWQPTFHDGEDMINVPINHTILHGRSNCEDGDSFIFSRRISDKDVPFLQRNGEVHVTKLNLTFKAHQCCIEYETYYDKDTFENRVAEMAVCCHPHDTEAAVREIVNSTLLTISAIFLFIMLAIYMLVPKLRNIHGKCLMSHAAALFVAFFLTVYNQFVGVRLGQGCDALGLMLYYSFIAALFWLNVMSFDIWWTFAHLRTQPPSERSLRNRFIRHSLYAWGVPLLMTSLLAFFNYIPYEVIPKDAILRPELGERKCFLSGPKQELYYFYVPIFIVTGVNIIFFLATARTLYQAEKSSRILNRKRTARDRLKVYVNLFIIMEVSWIAECLSTQIGPIQAWYFTDVINASQGTLIFILFIARSSTRQTIKDRFLELTKYALNPATRKVHPTGKTDDTGRTSLPTKTTSATTTSSSAARKSSEVEAYQMTDRNGAPTPDGVDGGAQDAATSAAAEGTDDGTAGGLDPAPHDSVC